MIRTTLKNKDGQELGAFENKDGYTELQGPLLIFLMPFKEWPETILPEPIFSNLLYDLHRATLSQAHDAGLFPTRH